MTKAKSPLQERVPTGIPGLDDETAKDIVRKAHGVCPYSRATSGNVPTTLVANGQPVEA